jgi:flavin reductase (DIM6/NTAB) family NADH-FMN oxidoreductase RutF
MAKLALKPGNYLYPLPPVLLTCGPLERPNIITLAWAGTLCSEPPILGVSIRPSRHSHGLVRQAGAFAVNVPTAAMTAAVDWCGNVSGRTEDKFAAMKLTPAPARMIPTAVIQECPVNIECEVIQTVHLGSHDLFLGRVVAVTADEALLDARGDIDLSRAKPLAYGSHAYWALGDRIAAQGSSVAK